MFEQSLVESTPLLRSRNRWPAIASILAQAAIVAFLVAIPLLHPEVLQHGQLRLNTLPPPVLPHPVPPPPAVAHAWPTPNSTPATPMQAPHIDRTFSSNKAQVDSPPLAQTLNLGPAMPNSLANLSVGTDTSPHVVVANAGSATGSGPATHAPLRISNMLAGMLLTPIRPEYPQMARLTRTQGTVVVQAMISRTGSIENAHALSGPAILQPAALAAVRSARYRPYLLNGTPVEVETTISITFHMND